jgi:hypothetical protein
LAGRVFVSYSRRDISYVRRLVEHLTQAGVPVWVDHDIEYGDQWKTVIRGQLDASAAVIVVMTPAAMASEWVAREVNYAKGRRKPLFPLLLAGDPFPALVSHAPVDVSGGAMPGADTVGALLAVVAATPDPAPDPAPVPVRGSAIRSRLFTRRLAVGAGVTVVLALAVLALLLPPLWRHGSAAAPTTTILLEPSRTPTPSSAVPTSTSVRAGQTESSPGLVGAAATTHAAATKSTAPVTTPGLPPKSTLVSLVCPAQIGLKQAFAGTVTVDHAYPTGQTVAVSVAGTSVTVPPSLALPAASTQANFSMTSTSKPGLSTIKATLNGSTVQCQITVTNRP